MRKFACLLLLFSVAWCAAPAQSRSNWRAASSAELEAVLPARAPVEKERIETEMRTATGIVNSSHQIIASVVLITAGYAADGKYSHYLLVQAPMTIGGHLKLAPGAYVVGWRRGEDGLVVHFYDALSGTELGNEVAHPASGKHRRAELQDMAAFGAVDHPDRAVSAALHRGELNGMSPVFGQC